MFVELLRNDKRWIARQFNLCSAGTYSCFQWKADRHKEDWLKAVCESFPYDEKIQC